MAHHRFGRRPRSEAREREVDAPRQSAGCQLTNLPVGHADEPLVHEFVRLGVPGLPLHDVALGLLVSQGDGGNLGGGI